MGLLAIIIALVCVNAATSFKIPAQPKVYEISIRPWLYELSLKYNKPKMMLRDVPSTEYQKLKDLNMDVIWFMGIWQLGDYGLNHDRTNADLLANFNRILPDFRTEDIIGSPYAITNYTCNPKLVLMLIF